MTHRIIFPLLCVLLLAACGEQDVHSACYKNGDHANMSDGRIIRICDCIDAAVKNRKPTTQETRWVIAWFNGKSLEAKTLQDKRAAAQIAASMMRLKANCGAIR